MSVELLFELNVNLAAAASDLNSAIPFKPNNEPDATRSPPMTDVPDVPLPATLPDTKKKTSDPAVCAAYDEPNPPAIATDAVVLSLGVGDNSFQLPDPAPPPVEEITT